MASSDMPQYRRVPVVDATCGAPRAAYIHPLVTTNHSEAPVRNTTWRWAAIGLLLVGCAKEKQASASTDSSAGAAANAAADTTKGMGGMNMDADKAMSGTGVPAGYVGVTDKPSAKLTDAKYTESGGRWEVETGPAHIVYAPKDSASGVYAVSASFQQLAKPAHPEAYGIFFGGQHLDDRGKQQYSYFLVRGTGEFLVKVRDGADTKDVVNWTANSNIPKQDASGKASYDLKVHLAPDTVHFFVNGKMVDAVPRKQLPSDGIAGLRINHNLHVSVTPVTLAK